jgi:hypothetical protein
MLPKKLTMRGVRVHDVREQLGDGVVLANDTSEALVRWDADTLDTWTSWNDLELLDA